MDFHLNTEMIKTDYAIGLAMTLEEITYIASICKAHDMNVSNPRVERRLIEYEIPRGTKDTDPVERKFTRQPGVITVNESTCASEHVKLGQVVASAYSESSQETKDKLGIFRKNNLFIYVQRLGSK